MELLPSALEGQDSDETQLDAVSLTSYMHDQISNKFYCTEHLPAAHDCKCHTCVTRYKIKLTLLSTSQQAMSGNGTFA